VLYWIHLLADWFFATGPNAGGLVGRATAGINNSNFIGIVSGTSFVGGLVGLTDSSVLNATIVGNVSGSGDNVGGLAGRTT